MTHYQYHTMYKEDPGRLNNLQHKSLNFCKISFTLFSSETRKEWSFSMSEMLLFSWKKDLKLSLNSIHFLKLPGNFEMDIVGRLGLDWKVSGIERNFPLSREDEALLRFSPFPTLEYFSRIFFAEALIYIISKDSCFTIWYSKSSWFISINIKCVSKSEEISVTLVNLLPNSNNFTLSTVQLMKKLKVFIYSLKEVNFALRIPRFLANCKFPMIKSHLSLISK